MSLPDYLLDEPDYCEKHGKPYPCEYCRFLASVDRADQLYDEWKEQHGTTERRLSECEE